MEFIKSGVEAYARGEIELDSSTTRRASHSLESRIA
jgi:hypothetical protein